MNLMESWGPGSKVLQKLDMVKQRVSWKQKHIKIIWGSWKQMDIFFWVGSELWRQEGEGLWMFEWEVALFERYFSVGGKFGRGKSSEAVFTLQTKSPQKSKIVGKLLAAWKFQWLFESQKPSIQNGEPSACPRTFLYHPWSWPCEKRWELMVGRISRSSRRWVGGLKNLMKTKDSQGRIYLDLPAMVVKRLLDGLRMQRLKGRLERGEAIRFRWGMLVSLVGDGS